jgi:hypothetical protein
VPRKISGAIPPLLNRSPWRGAWLKKTQGQLYLYLLPLRECHVLRDAGVTVVACFTLLFYNKRVYIPLTLLLVISLPDKLAGGFFRVWKLS